MLPVLFVFLQIISLSAQYNWQVLGQSPQNGQKQDDVFFLDPTLGWSVNGSGRIFKTTNGGQSWTKVLDKPGTYFRCIGFIDSLHGFAGNIGAGYFPNVSDTNPLYRTDDGGASWQVVSSITGDLPTGLCAIQVLSPQVIVAAGRVGSPTHFMKSTDGGATWTSQSMATHLAMITDVYFSSPDTGFVYGGTDANIQLAHAKILRTTNGGQSWISVYESTRPFEIIWKAHFPSATTGFATLLSYAPNTLERFVLKTTDAGLNWTELPLVSTGAKVFGVGFLDENTGWVGCDQSIYETTNGGQSWTAKNVGQYVNKIRVIRTPTADVAYGIGVRIYKMTKSTTPAELLELNPPRLFRAYPNPASDTVTLEFNLEDPAAIRFQMLDQQGKIVLETPYAVKKAFRQTETLSIGHLPAGTYFLTLQSAEQQLAQCSVVIQPKP